MEATRCPDLVEDEKALDARLDTIVASQWKVAAPSVPLGRG
jgi:hypothetical protein